MQKYSIKYQSTTVTFEKLETWGTLLLVPGLLSLIKYGVLLAPFGQVLEFTP